MVLLLLLLLLLLVLDEIERTEIDVEAHRLAELARSIQAKRRLIHQLVDVLKGVAASRRVAVSGCLLLLLLVQVFELEAIERVDVLLEPLDALEGARSHLA